MQIFSSNPDIELTFNSITLKDPRASVYAATAYTMSCGKPSAVLCFGVPEALSAASGALTAWGDKLRIIIVNIIKEDDFEILKNIYFPVTRGIIEVKNINAISDVSELSSDGPISILISDKLDFVSAVSLLFNKLKFKYEIKSRKEDISEILDIIKSSKRPLILAGRGSLDNISEIITLSNNIHAPVLLTASATAMPCEKLKEVNRFNALIIPSGNLVWVKAFIRSDVIIALGSGLSEVDWFGLKDTKIHRGRIVSVGGSENLSYKIADVSLTMDVKEFLVLANEKIKKINRNKWIEELSESARKWKETLVELCKQQENLDYIEPSFAAHQIVSRADENTIFVSEGGACGMWLWSHLWLRPFVFPVQNGTIGVTIPMCIGAKTGNPEHKVWAVMGDGAFFYHINELSTMKKLKIPAVIFIFNDSSWGAIRLAQTFIYNNNYIGTDIQERDYAKIAECYGCEGISVKTPSELIKAIEYAKGINAPLVIDVNIKKDRLPFAGANFVLAEFDGVLRYLIPGIVLSSLKNIGHRKLPRDIIKIIRGTML